MLNHVQTKPLPLHSFQVEPLFLEAERKNKLLRSVAGGGVEQLVELRTRWDKFEIMMESHQLMIKDQVGRGGGGEEEREEGRGEEERGGGRRRGDGGVVMEQIIVVVFCTF